MNKFKIFIIAFLPFISSCDFRIPQEWENPSWIFDLTIPLVNEEYLMSTIASESNNIEITPDTSNFIIDFKEELITEGDFVTDESFFIIPSSEIDLSLDQIIVPNPNPMPEIPAFGETIYLKDFIDTDSLLSISSCLPLNILQSDITDTIDISIDSFCEDIGDIECLNQIHWLKIGEGNNVLSINNNFPVQISDFELNILSGGEELINNNLSDIEGQEIANSDLFDKNLGCEVEGSIYFRISQNLEANSNFEECNAYESACVGYSDDTIWENDQCLILIDLDQDFCAQAGYQWNGTECVEILPPNTEFECELIPDAQWDDIGQDCYYIIEINEVICESEQMNGSWNNEDNECYLSCENIEACCTQIGGTWNGSECTNLPSFDGVVFSGDESLEISNQMNIESFNSLSADIECLIDTSYSFELPVDPNITLIEGHISDSDEDVDINKITLDLTNNFFSDILFNISSNNLFDSDNIALNNNQLVSEDDSFDPILLSGYTIKNNVGGPVESLSIDFSISLNQDSTIFNFDEEYGLSGDGVTQETIELDTLAVNFNEFSSSNIDMGNVPSGFEGFDIPDTSLTFNLYLYNQIDADMDLYLDLIGTTDDETLTIHVEPDISFAPPSEGSIDSLIISFFQNIMSVEHIGDDAIVIDTMAHKITDLFSYDQINVSGYAVMDGEATLVSGQSLWADIEIIINPLTIIIEDEFSFVSDDFTALSIMDEQTANKIDSGLVSASINMSLNNNIPFGGNLLIYISNHPNYLPLCIDSLQSGTINEQNISNFCMDEIQNYLACDTIEVAYDSLNFVNHMDCIGEDDFYYQSLLNLDFSIPNLDEWGNVIDTILTQQEIILEDEVYYFTRQNNQYLIPRFVFDNELDTITFQPSNSLNINSYIIFKLLTSGLLEE